MMKDRRLSHGGTVVLVCLIAAALAPTVHAEHRTPGTKPWISIIIDDIGYREHEDTQAVELPGPVAIAIMPHSPNAIRMSRLANDNGKDVLLHLPMQPEESDKDRFLGPGALTLNMTRQQLVSTVKDDLHSFPHIIGVNNHMGSLLTQMPDDMEWLMHYLRGTGKFYIDSVTSHQSVAAGIARENHIPALSRDVFLDNELNIDYINRQFDRLIDVARRNGHAIAIGHPHAQTLQVLANRLSSLKEYGVILVSLKRMVAAPDHDTRVARIEPPGGGDAAGQGESN